MNNLNLPVQSTQVDSFTNLNSLDHVKKMGREGDQQSLREVARQFEAMFVQQLLKTMRATEDVFAKGNYTQSSEMKFHRDLLDQQMSLSLTQGRGLGLAEALFAQMTEQYGKLLPPPTNAAGAQAPAGTSGQEPEPAPSAPVSNVNAADAKTDASASTEAKIRRFVDEVFHAARQTADALGVAVEGVIAQAALETGWGEHQLTDDKGAPSHNFFNIKADARWEGDSVAKRVLEYIDGVPITLLSNFRKYESAQAAFKDFTNFITHSPRYQEVKNSPSAKSYAQALQAAGYATDPAYAQKIANIANSPLLKNILAQKLL
ncbi:flagellar assembly peptidoglycan hydrolase FlgJ [Simiduia sp. 21SJ11W-1]|uniref:flagellar assembly peptidoglycan hydrolase FlgJ n=1 Tax=Simiduia sp. 21SJ11W-1 TaxID=2909669 RepID=UPI0020A1FAD4|nr:flagellar assembly peptidoglycan hydrolase FlgJ [Simiduia sp. 21SJ11W-1]UTA49467.1 flagellar assembly peptidoglycan hydrolase FlgJ [Simiduia sp. 21SJ11W-1]